jgi:hypothetical protein
MNYLTLVDIAGRLAKRAKKGQLAAMPANMQARFLDRARTKIKRFGRGRRVRFKGQDDDGAEGPDLAGDS